MQNMGRAKKIHNLNKLTQDKLSCPKGKNLGFVITDNGTYYCLRAALNSIPGLKLTNGYESTDILKTLNNFDVRKINSNIRSFQEDPLKNHQLNHTCDICEMTYK